MKKDMIILIVGFFLGLINIVLLNRLKMLSNLRRRYNKCMKDYRDIYKFNNNEDKAINEIINLMEDFRMYLFNYELYHENLKILRSFVYSCKDKKCWKFFDKEKYGELNKISHISKWFIMKNYFNN